MMLYVEVVWHVVIYSRACLFIAGSRGCDGGTCRRVSHTVSVLQHKVSSIL